jgi:hypothetical protein
MASTGKGKGAREDKANKPKDGNILGRVIDAARDLPGAHLFTILVLITLGTLGERIPERLTLLVNLVGIAAVVTSVLTELRRWWPRTAPDQESPNDINHAPTPAPSAPIPVISPADSR